MRIDEIMTRNVRTVRPDQNIREAAALMAQIDSGALLVNDHDRLVGMLTDRDIAIRAVAEGRGSETPVQQVMTPNIYYCFEDEDVQHVADNMADLQVRRLPVLSREKRLVGVVSLGNITSANSQSANSTVLEGVARAH